MKALARKRQLQMATIFISYSGEDRAQAAKLARALEDCGWSVWWDRKIVAGQHFDLVIERELERADAVIVLWSKSSTQSEWVKTEAAAAADRGVLVPALIEDCRLPLEFRRRQAANLIGWNGDPADAGFKAVSDGISELSGPPASAALADPARFKKTARLEKRRWIAGGTATAAVVFGVGVYGSLRLLAPEQGKPSAATSPSVTINSRSTAEGPSPASSSTTDPEVRNPGMPLEGSAQAGWFEFKWPGGDCWTIYRGDQKAEGGCGAKKQALQVGAYVIKPSTSAVFVPFNIDVKPGLVTAADVMAGWFEFKWPGGDCWTIYRGDQKVEGGCGAKKQALQLGTYVVKPSSSAAFTPFEVEVIRGGTVTAP